MFERLGSLTYRFRYLIVVLWVVGSVAAVRLAPSLASAGSTDQASFLPAFAPSVQARDAIERAFPGATSASAATLSFSRATGLSDADRAYLADVAAWMTSTDAPAELRDAVTGTESAVSRPELEKMLRSNDGQLELLVVNLDIATAGSAGTVVVAAMRDHLAATAPAGLETHVTGTAAISSDYLEAIRKGTESTTLVTILLVLVVLLLIYRAPLAALVPLVTIGGAFVVSRGVLGCLAAAGWEVSSLLDTFLVVLVFGVGTDYAIFLISRFREEVARGDWHDASRVTVRRIGSVISASAATVIVGMGAMAFGDFEMIKSTGPALGVAIFVTLVAGLTLAPALLAIFGHYLFWPLHTRAPQEGEPGGFFARLAAMVSHRPGLVTVVLLVALLVPAAGVPQMKTNFDVLSELPPETDARIGFDDVASHLGKGKLVQSTGLVDTGGADMLAPASLARLRDVMTELTAMPGISSVTSLVTPDGDGTMPDGFRPSKQLAAIADELGGDDGKGGDVDSAALLEPEVGDGLASALAYVEALGRAYPDVASGAELRAVTGTIGDAQDIVERVRTQSVLSTQLRTLASAMTSPASMTGSDTTTSIMGDYLDELAVAYPEVRGLTAWSDGVAAAAALEREATVGVAVDLATAFEALAVHFDDRPDARLSPVSLADTSSARELKREAKAVFGALPDDIRALSAVFATRSDDVFVPVGLGGDDAARLDDAVAAFVSTDGTATRFYVTSTDDPYSPEAFATIRNAQAVLTDAAPGFGSVAATYLGGPTAQFTDVQDVMSSDFGKVGAITVVGILLVLIVLLRAVVAPLYLVGTVLVSYGSAVGLSAWLFQDVLGQPGVSFYLPLMVFVLLVALGSDYNIFLMSRVREESETRPIRDGIRIASGHTGAVITSAGLILAGTFGSMASAPLAVLFQVGVAVAIGVLIDTFIVRSILVPAITTLVGDRAWWPAGMLARTGGRGPLVLAPGSAAAAGAALAGTAGAGRTPRVTRRQIVVALGLVLLVPVAFAGLLTWSLGSSEANLGSLPAAVVNLDQGGTMTAADGTPLELHLGADLADALAAPTATHGFRWVVTDEAEAAAGLADGRYAAILTIPPAFSRSIAVIRTDPSGHALRATLHLTTDDGTSGALGTVAQAVMTAITTAAAQDVSASYVDDVLLAVSDAHATVTTAADGARDIADTTSGVASDAAGVNAEAVLVVAGLEQLASGATDARTGTDKLVGGTRALATGADALADGAGTLAAGAHQAADGAAQLARGAAGVVDGLTALDASVSDLPAQAGALAAGAADLAGGAAGVATGATSLSGALDLMRTQTKGLGDQVTVLHEGAAAVASGATSLADGAGQAAAAATDLAAGAGQLATSVQGYTESVGALAAGCPALGGSDAVCAQLSLIAAQNGQLVAGADGVASGASQLAAAAA
ncbi:MAG: MMPL family transporter, partial [Candidatus Limnocylindrales bacterium]